MGVWHRRRNGLAIFDPESYTVDQAGLRARFLKEAPVIINRNATRMQTGDMINIGGVTLALESKLWIVAAPRQLALLSQKASAGNAAPTSMLTLLVSFCPGQKPPVGYILVGVTEIPPWQCYSPGRPAQAPHPVTPRCIYNVLRVPTVPRVLTEEADSGRAAEREWLPKGGLALTQPRKRTSRGNP